MVDDNDDDTQQQQRVCCMCGDVGFSEKLFRCNKCCHRFQHSYCSNYYNQHSEAIEQCDWCHSEEMRNSRGISSSSSRRSSAGEAGAGCSTNNSNRSHYSGLKIKQQQHVDRGEEVDQRQPPPPPAVGRNHGGLPSPKPSTRRYKLLKDVMC